MRGWRERKSGTKAGAEAVEEAGVTEGSSRGLTESSRGQTGLGSDRAEMSRDQVGSSRDSGDSKQDSEDSSRGHKGLSRVGEESGRDAGGRSHDQAKL